MSGDEDRETRTRPAALGLATELMAALNSCIRLRILALLGDRPHHVHELVHKLQRPQPLVSQHLRVLKRMQLVTIQRQGRSVIYSLRDPAVIELIDLASRIARSLRLGESPTRPADAQEPAIRPSPVAMGDLALVADPSAREAAPAHPGVN